MKESKEDRQKKLDQITHDTMKYAIMAVPLVAEEGCRGPALRMLCRLLESGLIEIRKLDREGLNKVEVSIIRAAYAAVRDEISRRSHSYQSTPDNGRDDVAGSATEKRGGYIVTKDDFKSCPYSKFRAKSRKVIEASYKNRDRRFYDLMRAVHLCDK